jgi:hypothetical protein
VAQQAVVPGALHRLAAGSREQIDEVAVRNLGRDVIGSEGPSLFVARQAIIPILRKFETDD